MAVVIMGVKTSLQGRHVFIYTGQAVVSAILPILTLTVLARFLSKEDFGALALSQVYAIFATNVCTLGMTEVFERSYFEYSDDRNKLTALLNGIIIFILANFIVVAVISQVFGNQIASALGFTQPKGLILLSFSGQFFSIVGTFYLLYFRNAGQALVYACYMILASGLSFLGAIGLVVYADVGIAGMPLAQTLSWIVVCILMARNIGVTLPPLLDRGIFVSAFQLAYPLAPRIFLGVVSTQLDKFLLGQLSTVGGVGIYSIAQRIAYFVFVFMTSLQNVFGPYVYKKMFEMKHGDDGTIGRYISPFLYLSVLAVMALVLIAEELFTVFMPVEYHGAISILVILSMYYGALFFGKITGKQLIFKRNTWTVSAIGFVAVVVNIVVCVPLVVRWGATGAAWGMFIAGILISAIGIATGQRSYRIRWECRASTLIYLVMFVSSLTVLGMSESGISYPVKLTIKLLLLGVYFYVGVRLNILTAAKIRELFKGFRAK